MDFNQPRNRKSALQWIAKAESTNKLLKEKGNSIIRKHGAYTIIRAINVECDNIGCMAMLEWEMENFSLLNEDILSCPKCNNEMKIPTMVIHMC